MPKWKLLWKEFEYGSYGVYIDNCIQSRAIYSTGIGQFPDAEN